MWLSSKALPTRCAEEDGVGRFCLSPPDYRRSKNRAKQKPQRCLA